MIFLGVGCAVTPESFDAEPQPLATPWPGPVSVGPGGHPEAISALLAEGRIYPLELDALSDKLARLLVESLEGAGTTIGPGGASLMLRVVHVDYLFEGPCLIDYTVTLGTGERFGLQAAGDVWTGFKASCGEALEAAVRQVTGDSRITEYLAGG